MLLHDAVPFVSPQNFAAAVWSSERVVLAVDPIAFTSAKSAAYARVVSPCCARLWNSSALGSTNGVTSLSHENGSMTMDGATGRHWPASAPVLNRNDVNRWSPARAAIIAAAAASPVAMPPAFAGPSGIA